VGINEEVLAATVLAFSSTVLRNRFYRPLPLAARALSRIEDISALSATHASCPAIRAMHRRPILASKAPTRVSLSAMAKELAKTSIPLPGPASTARAASLRVDSGALLVIKRELFV